MAEGPAQARTAVHCRRAAESDRHAGGPRLQASSHQLSHTSRVAAQGIASIGRHQVEAAGVGRLDHDVGRRRPQGPRGHELVVGPVHLVRPNVPSAGAGQSRQQPGTAVGHGHSPHPGPVHRAFDARRQGLCHPLDREGLLEGRGADENSQCVTSPGRRALRKRGDAQGPGKLTRWWTSAQPEG